MDHVHADGIICMEMEFLVVLSTHQSSRSWKSGSSRVLFFFASSKDQGISILTFAMLKRGLPRYAVDLTYNLIMRDGSLGTATYNLIMRDGSFESVCHVWAALVSLCLPASYLPRLPPCLVMRFFFSFFALIRKLTFSDILKG